MDTAVRVPEAVSAGREPRLVALLGLAVAGVAATTAAALLAHAGAESQPDLSAFARALMVAVPMAVGAYAWHRGPDARFGLVLIAAGAGWAVTTLAETDDSLAYTVGRTAGWVVELLVVYLVLCFPSGRLADRVDRLLAGAMAAVVAVFYGLQLVVAEDFSVPSPFTSCFDDCPANALFTLEREPAFVDAVMRPLGAVLVLVVMAGVVLRLYRRMHGSTPLTRRMLAPVVAIAMLGAGALGVAIVGRELEPTAWPIELAAWLLAIAVPAIALAFLVGLLRWRLFAGAALQHVAECLRSLPDALTLRRAFAEAFDDPTVEIVFPDGAGDGWMDCWGQPVPVPRPGSGRAVSEVRERGTVVAAIVHDAGLRARPELIEAGVSMAAVVLANQRLAAEAEASLRELQPLARTPGDRRGARAATDRARPARRRPAAAGRAQDRARAGRGPGPDRRRAGRCAAPGARAGRRRGARGAEGAGTRGLPAPARRPRPRGGAAVGRGAFARSAWTSSLMTSDGSRRRSRAPSTSASSRRSRTCSSTRGRPAASS